MVADSM